jgi:hypothetical protein
LRATANFSKSLREQKWRGDDLTRHSESGSRFRDVMSEVSQSAFAGFLFLLQIT